MFTKFLIVFYVIRTIRNIFYHLFWWERKEYRFDRMLIHLKETYQGRYWLFGPLPLIKWFLLFFAWLGYLSGYLNYLISFLFILEGAKNILELREGWKKPSFRPRILFILLTTSFFLFTFIIVVLKQGLSLTTSFLLADKLLGLVILSLIFFSNRLFDFYKQRLIKKAKVKFNHSNLKVIGITGSYGKTTTKELIAQLLGYYYPVLKTVGSQNTDIGIAERILQADLSVYRYFVCEMAAYKKGEIRQICQIFGDRIEIGVITGINEQHQSLFGSLTNTKRAKFELIDSLNQNGIAVFNANCKQVKDLILWAKQKKLKVIEVKKTDFSLPPQITGEHFQENLSLAVTVARLLGINKSQINQVVPKLNLPVKVMNVSCKGDLVLIDNTFNSNPDGVYKALSYLRKFKNTKVLVLQPLIELGRYSHSIHEKIGKLAAEICHFVVLTNKNFYADLMRGAGKNKNKFILQSLPNLKKATILFQGKEAESYLTKLKF